MRTFFSCLSCTLLGLLLAGPATAALVKLNPDLPPCSEVLYHQLTQDSRYAVYVADQDTTGVDELYSVPIEGGETIKLNPELVEGGSVVSSNLSQDGQYVVYLADQDTDDTYELYSVPITGGTAVKLNGELTADGAVLSRFTISPDSSRVIYHADQDTDGTYELYSVPITGGTPVKLNGALQAGGNVEPSFLISPDSSRVIYKADQDVDDVFELYSVSITGGTPVKLSGDLPAGGDVYYFYECSQDSSHVVYLADQDTDNVLEVYSVPVTGGTAIKLNANLTAGGLVSTFEISRDSSRVVYRADQDVDNVFELYSVSITGGTPVKLNDDLVAGGSTGNFKISPDASRVIYLADQDVDGVFELYSVPITGGAVVKLNGNLVEDGYVSPYFKISPDSAYVVYKADQNVLGVLDLFVVPITGGVPIKLNGDFATGREIIEDFFEISPDNSRVIYLADQDVDDVFELYSVPITGGTPLKINGDIAPGGSGVEYYFEISPDSSRVVYIADQDTMSISELYSREIAPRLYFPHIDVTSQWDTEIAVVNTQNASTVSGHLTAYDDAGNQVAAKETLTLQPNGRREINVASYFPGATYAVLTADRFDSLCGYTKFSDSGKYRVAVPAADSLNRGDLPIPHVASNTQWWTGISLVNTTPEDKTLTILCSEGTSFTVDLDAFAHQAFTFAGKLGAPQPDIESAVIQNADGVVGLELFGRKQEYQLSGVLLRDTTQDTLHFPHVDSGNQWWTGICAYNPGSSAADLTITSYGKTGEVLSTDTKSLDAGGKYIGTFNNLGLDQNSTWFMIESSLPLTGFELFGTDNGRQLAGFTAVGLQRTTGIFPKLETDGWTGIAFVNTGSDEATITLYAYNNTGTLIAEEPMTLGVHCKKVGKAPDLFSDDIFGASYILYSSTEPVVGFQLNGSADGFMLDGLPGMYPGF